MESKRAAVLGCVTALEYCKTSTATLARRAYFKYRSTSHLDCLSLERFQLQFSANVFNADSITSLIWLIDILHFFSHSSQWKGTFCFVLFFFCSRYRQAIQSRRGKKKKNTLRRSPLWDRNNKAHCLALVKGDIHLFLGGWQQWVAGALLWLNSKPIKMLQPLLQQPECGFNNSLNQSYFFAPPLRLFLILSFRSCS